MATFAAVISDCVYSATNAKNLRQKPFGERQYSRHSVYRRKGFCGLDPAERGNKMKVGVACFLKGTQIFDSFWREGVPRSPGLWFRRPMND
jgi:hypothetical protein